MTSGSPTDGPDGQDQANAFGELVADVYDTWHPGPESDPRTAAAVRLLAQLADDGPALELGVGTGRLAIPLAEAGIDVTGIDHSPKMLDRLRSKPSGQRVRAIVGDFTTGPLPGGPFRLAYTVFNTLFGVTSQDAQVRCFVKVAEVLEPGGVFVLEANVPDPSRFDGGQRVQVDHLGDDVRLSVSKHDRATQLVRTRYISIGTVGITTYPVTLRYVWPSELDLMGRLAGLELVGRYADWERTPYTSASPTHISVWRKPDR
jgi:SAM-dependent methyltransferase